MLDTLHVAYEGGTDAFPTSDDDEFHDGHEALAGRSPMQVIMEISKSGNFNGREDVAGAWVMRVDHQYPRGDEWTAAAWGCLTMLADAISRPETLALGRRAEA